MIPGDLIALEEHLTWHVPVGWFRTLDLPDGERGPLASGNACRVLGLSFTKS